jgi:hypothetical protein
MAKKVWKIHSELFLMGKNVISGVKEKKRGGWELFLTWSAQS